MARVGPAALGLVLLLAGALQAQTSDDPHVVQPERPSVATHAGTAAPGWIEVETGIELDRLDGARSAILPTVVKLGIARAVQLEVLAPLVRPPAGSLGPADAAVAVKVRLLNGAPVLGDFALQPSLKFPVGSQTAGRGTGTTDASLLLISSHQLGPVALDLNAGYTRRSGDGTSAPRSATVWAAAAGGPALGSLGWAAEVFGYPATTGPAGAPSIVALLGGPTFALRRWLVADAGVIVRLTGPQPDALYAGFVVNLGRLD